MRSSFLSFKVKVMKTFLKRFKSFYASSVFDLEYGREEDRRKRHLVKSSTLVTTKSNKKMPLFEGRSVVPFLHSAVHIYDFHIFIISRKCQ